MSLKPFYHPDDPTLRVCFRHSNRWFVQRLSNREPSREHDPWDDISRAQFSREGAIALMFQKHPLKLRSVL